MILDFYCIFLSVYFRGVWADDFIFWCEVSNFIFNVWVFLVAFFCFFCAFFMRWFFLFRDIFTRAVFYVFSSYWIVCFCNVSRKRFFWFFCDDSISGLFSSAQVCQTSVEIVGSGWDSISSAKIASGWKKSELISRNARIFFIVQS